MEYVKCPTGGCVGVFDRLNIADPLDRKPHYVHFCNVCGREEDIWEPSLRIEAEAPSDASFGA